MGKEDEDEAEEEEKLGNSGAFLKLGKALMGSPAAAEAPPACEATRCCN